MQILSLFDAPFGEAQSAVGPRVGLRARLLPGDAQYSAADYVLLREGESQEGVVAAGQQWWACLRGALALALDGDGEIVLMGAGDLLAPPSGGVLRVRALLDSVLVCAAPVSTAPMGRSHGDASWASGTLLRADQAFLTLDGEQARGPGETGSPALHDHAALATLRRGDTGWADALARRGLCWAACYRGTLRLQWWPEATAADRADCADRMADTAGNDVEARQAREAYLQPGMVYVPEAGETYRIEALSEPAGLLCGLHPALRAAH